MSHAIIGFGKIGRALAKAFARNRIEVSIATTHDPQSFAADAAAIGPKIVPKTLAEAVKADIIFLAVHFETHLDVAKDRSWFQESTSFWRPMTSLGPSSYHVVLINRLQ